MRQQLAENEIARKARKKRTAIVACDACAGVLDELAVFDARGAGGFASAAIEAFIDMVDETGSERKDLLRGIGLRGGLDADHLADAAARRVRLEIPKAVGGAGVEAESAVDAAGVIFVDGNETRDRVGGHEGRQE
jgi:hypothetical protein